MDGEKDMSSNSSDAEDWRRRITGGRECGKKKKRQIKMRIIGSTLAAAPNSRKRKLQEWLKRQQQRKIKALVATPSRWNRPIDMGASPHLAYPDRGLAPRLQVACPAALGLRGTRMREASPSSGIIFRKYRADYDRSAAVSHAPCHGGMLPNRRRSLLPQPLACASPQQMHCSLIAHPPHEQ